MMVHAAMARPAGKTSSSLAAAGLSVVSKMNAHK